MFRQGPRNINSFCQRWLHVPYLYIAIQVYKLFSCILSHLIQERKESREHFTLRNRSLENLNFLVQCAKVRSEQGLERTPHCGLRIQGSHMAQQNRLQTRNQRVLLQALVLLSNKCYFEQIT